MTKKNNNLYEILPRRRVHLLENIVSATGESFNFSCAAWKLKPRLRYTLNHSQTEYIT